MIVNNKFLFKNIYIIIKYYKFQIYFSKKYIYIIQINLNLINLIY